ncbi:MAG: metal-sulfur cluster assembly factor [Gallionella sp.]|nr:metal-sulfur cluster assembly factor [Gallionella sp.]
MPTDEQVRTALRSVIDPEVGINIVDLGLVYGVMISDNKLHIELTMTTPACPMGEMIMDDARRVLAALLPDGAEIELDLVWEPPWDPSKMSDHARNHFGWEPASDSITPDMPEPVPQATPEVSSGIAPTPEIAPAPEIVPMPDTSGRSGGLSVPFRLPLLILGFISLAAGVLAGLARMGWAVPLHAVQLSSLHGPLMVCGFLGTVIGLERAVALGYRWAYAGPLLTGLGGVAILLGFPLPVAAAAMALGSAVLFSGTILILLRQRELFMVTMALGAFSWLAGNLLWLTGSAVSGVVALWINFLVLTIAGERLELTRFLPPSPNAKRIFAVILAILLAGGFLNGTSAGIALYGIGLLGLALWLLRQDIARRTVKEQGLTRFTAVCLLSGYAWLTVGSIMLLVAGGLTTAVYAAVLHAILFGFVFSMVFGHAPIIFPAVVRVRMPYHWTFYLPLLALHASLLIRIAGDGLVLPELRNLGGLLNAITLVLFILSTVSSVVRGFRTVGKP